MNTRRVWISSPRRTASRTLERTFVGDTKLVDRLVEQVVTSVTSPNKHYNVIVGPDGVGKSHLLAVVCNRVQKQHQADDFVLAWLPDDVDGLGSLLLLFESILRCIGVDSEPGPRFRELDRDAETTAARQHLVEALGGRTLLLCVEDLDQVLTMLGAPGQRGLRAFLQEERCCTVLATTPDLTRDFTDQSRPFFVQ